MIGYRPTLLHLPLIALCWAAAALPLGGCQGHPEAPPTASPQKASAPLAAAPSILDLAPPDCREVLWVADLARALEDGEAYLHGLMAKMDGAAPSRRQLIRAVAPQPGLPFDLLDGEMQRASGIDLHRGLVIFRQADETSIGALGVDDRGNLDEFLATIVAPMFGGSVRQVATHGSHTLYGLSMPLASPTLWWSFVEQDEVTFVLFSGETEPQGLARALDAFDQTAPGSLRSSPRFVDAQRNLGQQVPQGAGALNVYASIDEPARRFLSARLRLGKGGGEAAAFVPGAVPPLSANELADRQANLLHTLDLARQEPADAWLLMLSHGGLEGMATALQAPLADLVEALPATPLGRLEGLVRALAAVPLDGAVRGSLHYEAATPADPWSSWWTSSAALSIAVRDPATALQRLEEAAEQQLGRKLQFRHHTVGVAEAAVTVSEPVDPQADFALAAQPAAVCVAAPMDALYKRLYSTARPDDAELRHHSGSLGRLLQGEDPADVAGLWMLRLGKLFGGRPLPDCLSGHCAGTDKLLRAALPQLDDVALVARLKSAGVHFVLANFFDRPTSDAADAADD